MISHGIKNWHNADWKYPTGCVTNISIIGLPPHLGDLFRRSKDEEITQFLSLDSDNISGLPCHSFCLVTSLTEKFQLCRVNRQRSRGRVLLLFVDIATKVTKSFNSAIMCPVNCSWKAWRTKRKTLVTRTLMYRSVLSWVKVPVDVSSCL